MQSTKIDGEIENALLRLIPPPNAKEFYDGFQQSSVR